MLETIERRNDFRIGFPVIERPQLETLSGAFDVHDASAKGLRVRDSRECLEVGRVVSAALKLAGGRTFGVRARVTRRDAHFVVLQVEEGLTTQDLLDEQRRLLLRFLH